MKNLGELPFCFGIQVTKDRMKRMINLGQAKYIGDQSAQVVWNGRIKVINDTS
jgi:hypothetical protein